MAAKTTLQVPHLGGITVGYRLSGNKVDQSKPTIVLINSMCTTAALYDGQFNSEALTSVVNLLAIEPLGHGATNLNGESEQWNYWDSAIMAIQVMEALGVDKAFALGTSMGGWIVVRMALLAPSKLLGLIPMGTSMDYESSASRELGCWNPKQNLVPFLEKWSAPISDFVVDEAWRDAVNTSGFGGCVPEETLCFWDRTLQEVYNGDKGRRKLRMAVLNLMERDGVLLRLPDVKCPVYWLHSPNDPVYSKALAQEHVKLFTGSVEASLTLVEGGGHYVSATSPRETEDAILRMVHKYENLEGRGKWNSMI